jgi:hypothetical protein
MNRKLSGWKYLTVPALIAGGLGSSGCDKVGDVAGAACGDCGTIATGDVGISGDARIDGFFTAVGTLNGAVGQIKADFDANIAALAGLYNIDVSAGIDGAAVDKVIAAIKAEVTANVSGGLKVDYKPAECKANINVAVKAQAQCEAKAKCDVQATPGEVSVKCEGQCSGSCDAECSGTATCAVEAPSVSCTGSCEGSCQLDVAASCTGTCHGTCSGKCDGNCSATDAQGNCTGHCDGKCSANCQGSCEMTAGASCSGKCTGKCVTDSGGAKCEANAECRGECKGSCSGGCTGTATPPSASANCEASADCQASASAQGSASLECTPPSLDVSFQLNASTTANASAQATFVAHMAEIKARGAAIVQGATKLKLLVQGDAAAKIPSPAAQIQGSLEGLISVDPTKFNIPAGKIICVVPALNEAVDILVKIGTDLGGTITAQGKFVAYITTGA